ncbi:MAG: DUF1343 domain-containing protein, partial [Pirellulales bacterium]|nr:DUF1343 domain-containing protein [Pirellulales bacterium]
FVGCHRLPIRHGMTVGELSRMFRSEQKMQLDLQIIPLEGWRRSDYFDATGLPWVNPSPNMRTLAEALLYPGIGLLEFTNLSVGRGTATPFELFGAPWLDGRSFAELLDAEGLPGVRFRAVAFVPRASKFAGQPCGGIEMTVTDRDAFRPIRTGLTIARLLRQAYPKAWETKHYDRLLGNRRVFEAILSDAPISAIEPGYQPELDEFLKRRARFLLY